MVFSPKKNMGVIYQKNSTKKLKVGVQEHDEFLAMSRRDGMSWEEFNRRLDRWLRKHDPGYFHYEGNLKPELAAG